MNNQNPRFGSLLPIRKRLAACSLCRHSLMAMAVAAAGMAAGASAIAQSVDSDGSAATGARLAVGAAAAYAPRYEGSDEYKARGLPLIDYRNGRFFAGTLGGIGYDFSPSPAWSYGPLLSYRFGRDQDDADRLRGLGDVDGGADLGGFVRWNLRPFFLHATIRQGIGGDVKGTTARFGAGYATSLSPSDRLIFDASVDWADEDVMQAYFGVTPVQSARSGLGVYKADAGIRRYGIGVIWTHSFTPQWFSTVGGAAWRLGDEGAASPITVDRNAGMFSAGIGYRF